tara:strand:- start:1271 stop:1534 length:264 start_codon:yes stop_codon:yes gene_type:complete
MSNLKSSANRLKNWSDNRPEIDGTTVGLTINSAGVPVKIAAGLIPTSCNMNDYIEAIETLKAFGLSERYGNFLIAEAENKLWGQTDA